MRIQKSIFMQKKFMQLKKTRILWTDDEIDSLHAHIIFLEEKGFDVVTANNGTDAIEMVKSDFFDIIFSGRKYARIKRSANAE